MYKPSRQESESTRKEIEQLFIKETGLPLPSCLLYGYYLQMGWIKQRVSRYLLAFSAPEEALVLVKIGNQGHPGTVYALEWSQITALRYSIRYKLTLQSGALPQTIRMFLPPFTATTMAAANIPPLLQQEEVAAFQSLLRVYRGQKQGKTGKNEQ